MRRLNRAPQDVGGREPAVGHPQDLEGGQRVG